MGDQFLPVSVTDARRLRSLWSKKLATVIVILSYDAAEQQSYHPREPGAASERWNTENKAIPRANFASGGRIAACDRRNSNIPQPMTGSSNHILPARGPFRGESEGTRGLRRTARCTSA
jgi:hypothetical protein